VIGELTVLTVTVVIGGDYYSYCDSGDRGEFIIVTVLVVTGELTVITVTVVIGRAYCRYCDSGAKGCLLQLL